MTTTTTLKTYEASNASIDTYSNGDIFNFVSLKGDNVAFKYEKTDNNVKISSNVSAKYYLDVTVAADGTVDGKTVTAGDYQLELAQRGEAGDPSYTGKYLWRLTPSYDSEGHDPYYVYIDLAEADFTVDGEGHVTGIVEQAFSTPNTLSMHVKGVMEKIGTADAVNVTQEFYDLIAGKTSDQRYAITASMYSAQQADSVYVTLAGYATVEKANTNIYVNGDSSTGTNLATQVYDVELSTSEPYTASWLKERITASGGAIVSNVSSDDILIVAGATTFEKNGTALDITDGTSVLAKVSDIATNHAFQFSAGGLGSQVITNNTLTVKEVNFDGSEGWNGFTTFDITGQGIGTLKGGANADKITAAAAGSAIYGMGGNDILIGNSSYDSFHFSGNFGEDTVKNAASDDALFFDGIDRADIIYNSTSKTLTVGSNVVTLDSTSSGLDKFFAQNEAGIAQQYSLTTKTAFDVPAGGLPSNVTIANANYNSINFLSGSIPALTFERTADTLIISGITGGTLTITGFNFDNPAQNIDSLSGGSQIASILGYTIDYEISGDYDKSSTNVYKENISLLGTLNSVNVSGLKVNDNIAVSSGYGLSRTASASSTLVITSGTKTINVTDYNFSALPAFNISGATSITDLNVTADTNYTASGVFNETIKATADVTVTGMSKSNDTLTIADGDGTKTYSRTASSNNLVIASTNSDATTTVTVADFFGASGDITVDGGHTFGNTLNVTADENYTATSNYKEIVTVTTNGVTVSGLGADDTLIVADAGIFAKNGTALDIKNGNTLLAKVSDIATNHGFQFSTTGIGSQLITNNTLTVNEASFDGSEGWSGFSTFNITGSGAGILKGGANADIITAAAEGSTIYGMGGNDTLTAGAGNDMFHFSGDFGEDTVNNASSSDKLFFDGISRAAITYSSENKTFTVGNAQDGNIVTLAESSSGLDKFQAVNEAGVAQEYSLSTTTAFDVPAGGLPSNVTIANANYNSINFLSGSIPTLTFERTADNTLVISGITGGTLTITGFNVTNYAQNIDSLTGGSEVGSISGYPIAYEISGNYNKSDDNLYKENIRLNADLNSVNVSGLESGDNLNIASGYALSRTASVASTLVITSGTKTINVTDYNFSTAVADVFDVAGADITTDLTVTANADYTCSGVFAENITVSGSGIKIAGIGTNDSLHFASATTYRIDGTTLTISDGTNSVIIENFNYDTVKLPNVYVGESTTPESVADKTLTVTGLASFDAQLATSVNADKRFKSVNITGVDDASNVFFGRHTEDGNDVITIGDNNSIVRTTIDHRDYHNYANGLAGSDTIYGGIGNDEIYGDSGVDHLYGGAGDDLINGLADNDYIDGGAGVDILYGDAGDDEIHGGDGNDTIVGHAGADILYGDDGIDNISGSEGDDTIYGGAGNDFVYGNEDNDILYGDAGNDELAGWTGTDTIYGGAGQDTIWGDQGNDKIWGGTGAVDEHGAYIPDGDADTFKFNGYSNGDDIIYDAEKADKLDFDYNYAACNLTFTRTADGKLKIGHAMSATAVGTITIGNFDFSKTGEANNNIDTMSFTDGNKSIKNIVINYTLQNGETFNAAGDYKYNLSLVEPTLEVPNPSANVSGLKSGDNLNIGAGYTLSRDYGTNTVVNSTLVVKNGNKRINVTGYDFSALPAFKIAGAASTAALNVSASADYPASNVFSEAINAIADITVTGMSKSNDTLTIADGDGTKTYSRTASNNSLVIASTKSDVTTTVTVADFFGSSGDITVDGGHTYGNTLNVTADENYVATSNYKEIITVTTNGVTVSGLSADDTLILSSGTKRYEYDTNTGALTIKIGDDVIATVSDYGTNRAFSFGESIANSVLYVTGNTFDAQPPGQTAFAFGSYNITGDASSSNIYHAGNVAGNNDTIYVGDNNTHVLGSGYNNYANGWAGNDTIYGGIGKDELYGQTGNDTIYGGAGDDLISGDDNDDSLYGGTGNDTIYGGNGHDNIYGGTGDDTIYGGAGIDTYVYDLNSGGNDIIKDDMGADKITFSETTFADSHLTFTRNANGKLVIGYELENNNSEVDNPTGTITLDHFNFTQSPSNYNLDTINFTNGSIRIRDMVIDYTLQNGETFDASGSYKYNLSLAENAVSANVINLKAGDNITFANGALSRVWDGTKNNFMILTDGTKSINVTDYFATGTYPAFKLNTQALPTALTVTLDSTVTYETDSRFAESISGNGAVTGLGDNDKIVMKNETNYTFDATKGLTVADETNSILIADNTTAKTDKVYVGTTIDDISTKKLTAINVADFNASELGYKNYDITGTGALTGAADSDVITATGASTITGGQGADTLKASAAADAFVFNAGDGSDTITNADIADKIVINANLDIDNLTFSKNTEAGTLTITGYGADGDSITVNYDNAAPAANIDRLELGNGVYSIKDYVTFDIVLVDEQVWNKTTSIYNGYKVNILLANDADNASVLGLKEGDNITLANGALSRVWDGAKNNILTLSDGTNSINVNDYFSASTYPALSLNNASLPTDLKVTIQNTNTYTTHYPADSRFAETISGNGAIDYFNYVADKLLLSTETKYTYDALGLTVSDDVNALTVVNYYIGNEPNVYVGTVSEDTLDDITVKTLYVEGNARFDASSRFFRYKNVNIEGTEYGDMFVGSDNTDIISGGAGDDVIYTGKGDDTIYGGAGNDTIVIDGAGTNAKNIYGGTGNDTFYFDTGSAVIYDATSADKIQFKSFGATNLIFTKQDKDIVISNALDTDTITIKNYFNEDGSVAADHIVTFVINGADHTFDWKLSNVDGEYHMYNIIIGTEGRDSLKAISGIRNWVQGRGEVDIINGGSDVDVLEGNTGDDMISTINPAEAYGGSGNDIMHILGGKSFVVGGSGNDSILLNNGNNTVCFIDDKEDTEAAKLNFGTDTVENVGSTDTLQFAVNSGAGMIGYSVVNMSFAKGDGVEFGENDLVITAVNNSTANKAVIKNYFAVESYDRPTKFITKEGELTLEWRESNRGDSAMYNIVNDPNKILYGIRNWMDGSASEESMLIRGGNKYDTLIGTKSNDMIYAGDTSTSIPGHEGAYVDGGAGNDMLYGSVYADYIKTGDGYDYVYALDGDDTIVIDGTGTKTIKGGKGHDIFYFDTGSAILSDATSEDKIQFKSFGATNLKFTKQEDNDKNIVISNGLDDDTITIENYFNEDGSVTENHIKTFVIGDKEYTFEWRLSNVDNQYHMYNIIEGTEGKDTLNAISGIRNWVQGLGEVDTITGATDVDMLAGDNGDDVISAIAPAEIYGGSGNDQLAAVGGKSFVVGGSGNDKIEVLGGSNTICFINTSEEDQLNFGNDTISGTNSTDILKMAVNYGTADAPDLVGYTKDQIQISSNISVDDGRYIDVIVTAKNGDNINKITIQKYNSESVDKILVKKADGTGYETIKISDYVDGESGITVNTKKKTITGTDKIDVINVRENSEELASLVGKNKTIKALGGDDVIYAGTGNDKLYGGEGDDKFVFEEGNGVDTIYSDGGDDYLEFRDFDTADLTTFEHIESGKDLIIQYGSEGDKVVLKDFLNGGHSVKEYAVFDTNGGLLERVHIADMVNDPSYVTLDAEELNKTTVKGSVLSETIIGSNKNNTLRGGGGNDLIDAVAGKNKVYADSRVGDSVTVYSGTGDDTLNAGIGYDKFVFFNGHGNDTVIVNAKATTGTSTVLDFSNINEENITFSEKGNNLIITNTYERESGMTVSETTTIKNYLKNKYTQYVKIIVKDADTGFTTEQNLYQYLREQQAASETTLLLGNIAGTKNQKVTGSFLDETLVGGIKNDTIKSNGGIDSLYGNEGNDKLYGYIVTTKEGKVKTAHYNDVIAVDNAKIYDFGYDYNKVGTDVSISGDGKDTIYNAKYADKIRVLIDASDEQYVPTAVSKFINDMTLTHKSKNMTINYGFGTDKKGKTVVTDSITISGYDKLNKSTEAVRYLEITTKHDEVVATLDLVNDFNTEGKYNGGNEDILEYFKNVEYAETYTVDDNNSRYNHQAKYGNDTYNISGTAAVVKYVYDGHGNDTYNTPMDQYVYIEDTKGYDTLNLTSTGNVKLFFDVAAEGSNQAVSKSLLFVDSATIGATGATGSVEVANWFDGKSDNMLVNVNNEEYFVDMDALDVVRSNVAGWLASDANTTGYDTAEGVLKNSGDADAIAELMQLYNT